MVTIDHIDKTVPVLLVEDEAFIATEIEQMLFNLGFEAVVVCLNHKTASEQVSTGGFGLAIFDINVGGMLSYSLISSVIAKKCPVVTMSGYISGADAFDGRVFISKPIDEKLLTHAIVDAHRICLMQQAG
jgi:DNA-binding NtrC family response regulator